MAGNLGSLPRRVLRRFQSGGWPALAEALQARAAQQRAARPVWWAGFGAPSRLLARAIRPQSPPALVLAFPRSGSTWVGETLGRAANALYLEEPINQSVLAAGVRFNFVKEPLNPPEVYRRHAAIALSACPAFRLGIVKLPGQWSLAARPRRRLVLKEVHPAACAWLLRHAQPRLVLLVRHPAAVALSYKRLGWWTERPGEWHYLGDFQGRALRAALAALADYPAHCVARYEDLCADPLGEFRRLFDFAGLDWGEPVEAFIQRATSGGDSNGEGRTARHSLSMISAWRGSITAAEAAELRAAYRAYDLPWYRADEEW